jgi:hypothetical protein
MSHARRDGTKRPRRFDEPPSGALVTTPIAAIDAGGPNTTFEKSPTTE